MVPCGRELDGAGYDGRSIVALGLIAQRRILPTVGERGGGMIIVVRRRSMVTPRVGIPLPGHGFDEPSPTPGEGTAGGGCVEDFPQGGSMSLFEPVDDGSP